MASVLPKLTASLNPKQRGGRAERHFRKTSLPEHNIVRLKSFAFTLSESVSPSPDLSFSDRYHPPSASRGQRSDMRFRQRAKAVLDLTDPKPATFEVGCQTHPPPKASQASPRKASLYPFSDELLRIEERLDYKEVARFNSDAKLRGTIVYVDCLEELTMRVKRTDERLAALLTRVCIGLRRAAEDVEVVYVRKDSPRDRSPRVDTRKETAAQTDSASDTPQKANSSGGYPALATAQEALLRLRDVKYSGVSTKLTELHRALSRLTQQVPEAPLPSLPSAAEPSEFSLELTETLRTIQRDIAHTLMMRNKRPPAVSVGTQANDQSVNLKEVFRLEEAVKERDLDLAKLRNELIDAKVAKDCDKDMAEKQKSRLYELEERTARLDIELKSVKKKETTLIASNSDLQQQVKTYEGRMEAAKHHQMHLISMLYGTGDRARKAEKGALAHEEALAQAKIIQEFNEQKLKLVTGGKAGGADRLEIDMKQALERVTNEYQTKKEDMRRRHQQLEQDLQAQVVKVDALLETATKMLKPSTIQPLKVPKPKGKVEQRKESSSEESEEEVKTTQTSSIKKKSEKSKQAPAIIPVETDHSQSSEPEEVKSQVVRSPTRSPTRKTTLFSPSPNSPSAKEPSDRPIFSGIKPQEITENPVIERGEGGQGGGLGQGGGVGQGGGAKEGKIGGNEGSLSVKQRVESQVGTSDSVGVQLSHSMKVDLGDIPDSTEIDPLDAFAAESYAEERELLDQLSPSEQEVFYKVKTLFEHQSVWEKAVRAGVSSKGVQVGDSPLRSRAAARPPMLTSIFEEDAELKNWPKELEESGEMSPTTRRKYQFAVWRALSGHGESCQNMCKHLRRAMKVRRKVKGLLAPLRVVTLSYLKK